MNSDLFSLDAYKYDLPEELIAQKPSAKRDQSRLLIVDRASGQLSEIPFQEISHLLQQSDRLIFNNTRVIPARLLGKRAHGGITEVFLLKEITPGLWKCLVRPGKKLREGDSVIFGDDFSCTVASVLPTGERLVQFNFVGSFTDSLIKYGQIPLPHYIQRSEAAEEDNERYQTVYAKEPGAVAAPTAGLHFSNELMQQLKCQGVEECYLTLHVGLGTFKPVQVGDIRQHEMHKETLIIDEQTASALNSKNTSHLEICVGTTTCRALESAADSNGLIHAGTKETDIFIYPGYKFKRVHSLLTNFHLPGSSLLMLVSAFAGYELIMEAYQKAIKERFRFYSYGDAMLIL